ncbi:MAG: 50S ribosomal protein L11 methyltransferase [Eubacteriales bacterium]
MLDVGTGSGILAICASKLGAEKCKAYDIDRSRQSRQRERQRQRRDERRVRRVRPARERRSLGRAVRFRDREYRGGHHRQDGAGHRGLPEDRRTAHHVGNHRALRGRRARSYDRERLRAGRGAHGVGLGSDGLAQKVTFS